jgi:RNA polymerase sigma factor for flagellar operon FliA
MTEIRTKSAPGQAEALWKAFADRRDGQTRNLLVEHYLPLVNSVAQRLHSGLPQEVQFDDLFSAGVFGLMGAINAFELTCPHFLYQPE